MSLTIMVLIGTMLACLSAPGEEDMELRPTLILTPYATETFTPSPTPIQSPTPTATATPRTAVYVVVPGDTLSGIAQRYGVSVSELMALNGLGEGDILSVGQELRVPAQ